MSLPLNYILTAGTLYDNFSTGWEIVSGDGTIEADTTWQPEGIPSQKVTTSSTVTIQKTVNWNLRYVVPSIYITTYQYSSYGCVSNLNIKLATDSGITKYYWKNVGVTEGIGKTKLSFAQLTRTGATNSWKSPIIRMQMTITAAANQTAIVSFGGIYFGEKTLPMITIGFDDGYQDVIDNAAPILAAYGMPATYYITSDYADALGAGFLASLDALYAVGWDISNHSKTHTRLFGNSTDAQITTEVNGGRDWLIARGYTRSANHLSYPGGSSNAHVEGLMQTLGVTTARGTRGFEHSGALLNPYDIYCSGPTVSTINAILSAILREGGMRQLYFHHVTAAGTEDYSISTANFRTIIEKVAASRIKVVTMSEYFNGLTNPRYQSLPVGRT